MGRVYLAVALACILAFLTSELQAETGYWVRHVAPDGNRAHIAMCLPYLGADQDGDRVVTTWPTRLHKLRSPDGKVVTIWAVQCHES